VTSCIVDSAAIYIMVVKFVITICPPLPQLSLHRRAALSSNSNGTRSVSSRKNPKSSLYCEMSMLSNDMQRHFSLYGRQWKYQLQAPCHYSESFKRGRGAAFVLHVRTKSVYITESIEQSITNRCLWVYIGEAAWEPKSSLL
jgi:hypothetical protein